jgi:hypothetical protein
LGVSARRGNVPARVHVTIDRLVLDGVSPVEARVIVAALRRQLQQTFATPRAAEEFGDSRPVVRGTLDEPATGSPARTAAGISAHIARGVLR